MAFNDAFINRAANAGSGDFIYSLFRSQAQTLLAEDKRKSELYSTVFGPNVTAPGNSIYERATAEIDLASAQASLLSNRQKTLNDISTFSRPGNIFAQTYGGFSAGPSLNERVYGKLNNAFRQGIFNPSSNLNIGFLQPYTA